MGGVKFVPTDIPDLSGKVIFVTGGTDGLGAETVRQLAAHSPAHFYFSGRNEQRANDLISAIKKSSPGANLTFLKCDLASLASVKATSQGFLSSQARLDLLICNAGIMAKPPSLTTDGYELQFGTNHVGHALLIKYLLPRLLDAASAGNDARLILLTSQGHVLQPSGGIRFATLKTPQDDIGNTGMGAAWTRYGQSKLANVLYAAELARRHPQLTTVSVHPGVIGATGLQDGMGTVMRAVLKALTFWQEKTVEAGALNQLWAATTRDKSGIVNGAYYEPVGYRKEPTIKGKNGNGELARELWDWTEKELEAWI